MHTVTCVVLTLSQITQVFSFFTSLHNALEKAHKFRKSSQFNASPNLPALLINVACLLDVARRFTLLLFGEQLEFIQKGKNLGKNKNSGKMLF